MSLQNSHDISSIKVMLKKGADGDSITSIEKTGTSGLVDTYTITLNTGAKYTFTVTNGKSIVSVEKTATVGLVDTYTITYNDGSTDTFDVTNGKDMEPDVSAIVNVYGSKNLNSYPYNETTKAINGVTYTDNGDGTIKATGSASANTSFACNVRTDDSLMKLQNGTYILSGFPVGADNTYCDLFVAVASKGSGSREILATCTGDEVEFTIDGCYYSDDWAYVQVTLEVKNGYALPTGGITFKPMIRDARISDDTFAPYAKTNRELTADLEGEPITFTTTTTGVSNIFGNGTKTGRVCNVSFFYAGNVNTSTPIGTLSVKPNGNVYVTGTITLSDNSVKVTPFLIDSDGKVYQQGSNATTTNGQFSGTYIC